MPELEPLLRLARACGHTAAVPLEPATLRFLPQVREMCRADRCLSYGRNWTCPPACGPVEAFAARAAACRQGMLVQTVGSLADSFDWNGMQAAEALHKRAFSALLARLREQDIPFFALGAGACTLCKTCTYPGAPCRFPERAVPSMEAAGLWVSDVCEKNALRYDYSPGGAAFTSCVLFP